MTVAEPSRAEARFARILAHVAAANGHVDDSEIAVLEQAQAFQRMALTRASFIGLAHEALDRFGSSVSERGALGLSAHSRLLALVLPVHCPEERILLRELVSQVVNADGRVTPDELDVCEAIERAWRARIPSA